MILLNTINRIPNLDKQDSNKFVEKTTRMLVHAKDVLQVYEEHTDNYTHTYAIIKSPTGAPTKHRIRESIVDTLKYINGVSVESYSTQTSLFPTIMHHPV